MTKGTYKPRERQLRTMSLGWVDMRFGGCGPRWQSFAHETTVACTQDPYVQTRASFPGGRYRARLSAMPMKAN